MTHEITVPVHIWLAALLIVAPAPDWVLKVAIALIMVILCLFGVI